MPRFPRFDLPQGMPSGVSVTPLVRRAGRGMSSTQLRFGGTAFPARPADGDLFFHRTANEWFYYDSGTSKWLSTTIKSATLPSLRGAAQPINANTPLILEGSGLAATLFDGYQLVAIVLAVYVSGTHDSNNYWDVTVNSLADNTLTAQLAVTTWAMNPNLAAWRTYSAALSALVAAHGHWEVSVTKGGSGTLPGGLYLQVGVHYRTYKT